MVTAVVLIKVERGRVNEVAEHLSALSGISEVYSVAGRYDLVALLRVGSADALAELVTHRLMASEHIVDTETLIAFRAYSRHDLDAMFEVGLDG